MTDEDRALLLELSRVSKNSGDFALGVMENTISGVEQIAFAYRLLELGKLIRDRARQNRGVVIEGVVDGDSAQPGQVV